jgi:hypothetical protein
VPAAQQKKKLDFRGTGDEAHFSAFRQNLREESALQL